MYLENVSHDRHLITGQNPWSVWKVSEKMIEQLGYTPKYRALTGEENAVNVLTNYNRFGREKARTSIYKIVKENKQPVSRLLIAKHSIMSAMQGDLGKFVNLLNLTSYAKNIRN